MLLFAFFIYGFRALTIGFIAASANYTILRRFLEFRGEWMGILLVALSTALAWEMTSFAFMMVYDFHAESMIPKVILLTSGIAFLFAFTGSMCFIRSESGRRPGLFRSAFIAFSCVVPSTTIVSVWALLEGLI